MDVLRLVQMNTRMEIVLIIVFLLYLNRIKRAGGNDFIYERKLLRNESK